MKDLKFICAQPDDTYYTWQVHLWLESLKNIGHVDKAIVLIFTPKGRNKNTKWKKVINLYPEAEFNFFNDDSGELNSMLRIYIPVLRPYILWKYFESKPEMKKKSLFYCDSDILFLENFNIDKFLEDDICYLSDTNSYINSDYFDSKIKDVLSEKLEEYKSRDILSEITSKIGINRKIAELNVNHSGGAQYLLKNIDSLFWKKVMDDSILIRTYLQKINIEYFENESKGFQSWCADMWAVLWNLWLRNQKTKVIPELNFAWSSDPIDRLKSTTILHNAGIVSNNMNHPCFYKGDYHLGKDPTKDKHLDVVLNNNKSKKFCTWHYANDLKKLSNKYKLKY
tara:strand:+ start:107 stop:1123 length:1017 start_codon:yes stop_codon:yes gene_type:complete